MRTPGPAVATRTRQQSTESGDVTVPGPAWTTPPASAPEVSTPPSLGERIADGIDRLLASPAFHRWAGRLPLVRIVARRRSRAVFDLCAGFVYSQVLSACVRLDLFERLAGGAVRLETLAAELALPPARLRRLVDAAVPLSLLRWRRGDRVALGALGAPLVGNRALATLVEHHALFYDDLRDPVALLRGDSHRGATALAAYWPYAGAATASHTLRAARVAHYSATMAATLPPLAEEVLDAYDFARHARLLDVGGGEGVFCTAAAARHAALACDVYDLPAVAERATRRFDADRIADRARAHGGNFLTDDLPRGADVVTLIRVLLDHPDDTARGLLRRIRAALPAGGRLVIAEAFAGAGGPERVGATYFGLYLMAMGGGRARRAAEYRAMLKDAGFRRSWELDTRYPVQTGLLVAEA
jgi:demethylspheroidene O-methyltransferase